MSAPNLLSLGIRVTSDFDDNALNDHNNNKQANSLTSVEPYVGWSLSVPRGRWSLDYRPGFSMGRPISIYDSRSELLDTNFSVTLTKRLQLRLRESLLKTKNAFDQLQQSDMAHGSSVLDRPNDSILAATREDSEQAGGDLSYALNARTVIGVSAAFYSVNYSSALNAQALGSAQSFGTHTFTSYQLTRHHWIGFDYNIQNLTSDRPQVRSLVQSLLYTDTRRLRPTMEFSFFLGPQHLQTQSPRDSAFGQLVGMPSVPANWSWAGGADYVWSKDRTNIALSLSRRISDGAGFEGVVELFRTSAQVHQQITRHWEGELLFANSRNRPLASIVGPLSYLSFGGGLSRALNRRLSIDCQYWWVHETGSSVPLTGYLADHNQIAVSVLYNVKVPLQR